MKDVLEDEKVLQLITEYLPSMNVPFQSVDNCFKFATPLTQDEISIFINNCPEEGEED